MFWGFYKDALASCARMDGSHSGRYSYDSLEAGPTSSIVSTMFQASVRNKVLSIESLSAERI